MIMCQVLKRIIPQPVPSDFSASEYVAGDIMANQLLSAVWVFHGFEELISEIVVMCTFVLVISIIDWIQLRFGHMLCFRILPCLAIWEIICQIAQVICYNIY